MTMEKTITFAQLINSIHTAKDIISILAQVARDIRNFFKADRITIYLIDKEKKELYSYVKTGQEVSEIRLPLSFSSIAGYVALVGKVVNITDVYNSKELLKIDPRLRFDSKWDQMTGYRCRQMLVAPITHDKKRLGVIQLINRTSGDKFTEEDEKHLQLVCRALGGAIYTRFEMAKLKAIHETANRFSYLIERGFISKEQLTAAYQLSQKEKRPVEEILLQVFKVPKKEIVRSICLYNKCLFIDLKQEMIVPPSHLIENFSASYLKKNGWIPIREDKDEILVMINSIEDYFLKEEIKKLFYGKKVSFTFGFKEDISNLIDEAFKIDTDNTSTENLLEELKEEALEIDVEEEEDVISEHDSAIVKLVNRILVDAIKAGASDIHIEPYSKEINTVVRFRVDGACYKHLEIPYQYTRAVVSRLKIMAKLDIAEKRLPQDGKIIYKYQNRKVEMRVATIPTVGGNEDVVIRILTSSENIMKLEELGLSPENFERFKQILSKPYGLILVVGPTGSGKTTTLHAALQYIKSDEKKIWTVEDPVEITQYGIRQVQVIPKIGLNFSRAMRAFLRADPDIILVGETRDRETASMLIEASLTGHLVFSTLHTNNAPETLTRLINMGIDPLNLSESLLGVLAQRLVRKLCSNCKEPYQPSKEELNELKRLYGENEFEKDFAQELKEGIVLYRKKGCSVCKEIGYKGRMGIHELLINTSRIKPLILKKDIGGIKKAMAEEGMKSMFQDGIRKLIQGHTDLYQLLSVVLTE